MIQSIASITVACNDPQLLAEFWCAVLDYEVLPHRGRSIRIGSTVSAGPDLFFSASEHPKDVKNRWHIDVRTRAGLTLDGVIGLGARRIDIGQSGTEPWTVLEDPEGNEFCLLDPRAD